MQNAEEEEDYYHESDGLTMDDIEPQESEKRKILTIAPQADYLPQDTNDPNSESYNTDHLFDKTYATQLEAFLAHVGVSFLRVDKIFFRFFDFLTITTPCFFKNTATFCSCFHCFQSILESVSDGL